MRTRRTRMADMPRLHRGREMPHRALPPARKRRAEDDDQFGDMDLDEILDIDDEEIEDLDEEDVEELGEECPVGCVPASEVAEEEAEEAEEEAGEAEESAEEAEEAVEEETTEASVAPPAETPAATETTAAPAGTAPAAPQWTPLFSKAEIAAMGSNVDVDLLLYNNPEDPFYVVTANGHPIGEIRQSDAVQNASHKALFLDQDTYVKGVTASIAEFGLGSIMDELGMRYYASTVEEKVASGTAKELLARDQEQAFQSRLANLKHSFLEKAQLAIEASTKNLFVANPLRDALRRRFADINVADALAIDLIEEAMQEAGAEYFAGVVAKADEWLGTPPEAYQAIEKEVRSARYVPPAESAPVRREIPRSVPMRTMASPQQQQAPAEDNELEGLRSLVRRSGPFRRR